MNYYKSLTSIFFSEIDFDYLINEVLDTKNISEYDIEYYDSRYDFFYILNNIDFDNFNSILNNYRVEFEVIEDFFDEEIFKKSTGIYLFIDELNDFLNSFNRGKAYTIEKVGDFYIHHFELSYNAVKGKTIIVSNKNEAQIHFYFKSIIKLLKEKPLQKQKNHNSPETNIEQELKGFKIEHYDKLTEFRKALIEDGFIDKETKIADFRAVFDDKIVTKRIIWKKAFTHLNYLIKTLYDEKIITNDEDKKWVITANCFVMIKDGKFIRFDSKKIGKSNRVGKKASDKIHLIIKSINFS